jgi:CheY-like chemotaxis protein
MKPITPAAMEVHRVLYVEDAEDNFLTAELQLRKRYALTWARSDEEAVRLLKENPRGFAAILMDIELQGAVLDGIKLTRLIRGKLPLNQHPPFAAGLSVIETPVIYVTAYGTRYPEAELLATGASAVITKPVNFLALSMAIATASMRG